MASPSRKRKAITLETKYEIIESVQTEDAQTKDIASKFGIPPNTLGTILKIKDLIVASYENFTTSTSVKRNRSSSHVTRDNINIENALLGWFKEKRNQNIPFYFLFTVRIRYKVYIDIANYGYNEVFTCVPRNSL